MKAQAMAMATSMASRMKKSISPHEGPRGVAWGSDEFPGCPERPLEFWPEVEGIHLSVCREPSVQRPATKVLSK
jgi:hypothetical protein